MKTSRRRTLQSCSLLLLPLLLGAGVPAGTLIQNIGTYEDDQGVISSQEVTLTVLPVCQPNFITSQSVSQGEAGKKQRLSWELIQKGNVAAPITLEIKASFTSQTGLNTPITGVLRAGEQVVNPGEQIKLDPDQQITVSYEVEAPGKGNIQSQITASCEGAQTTANGNSTSATQVPQVEKRLDDQQPELENLTVSAGDEVRYRIEVRNPNEVSIRDIETRDMIEPGLEYISASPEPTEISVTEQGTLLRWNFPWLSSKEVRSITLKTRVKESVGDDEELRNVAIVRGEGGENLSSPPVVLRSFTSQMIVEKSSESSSVINSGGLITYAITVRNPSKVPIYDVKIHDENSDGLTLVEKAMRVGDASYDAVLQRPNQKEVGINLVQLPGTGLHLATSEFNLLPGEQATLRYKMRAPMSYNAPLRNQAYSQGQGRNGHVVASVNSNRDDDTVYTRSEPGISTGDIAGRVYLDTNDNQRYERGTDKPVQNARVILAGGREVLSDKEGRYSLRNLSTGHHTIVLDPRSVPGNAKEVSSDGGIRGAGIIELFGGIAVHDFPLKPKAGQAEIKQRLKSGAYEVEITGNVARLISEEKGCAVLRSGNAQVILGQEPITLPWPTQQLISIQATEEETCTAPAAPGEPR